MYLLSILDFGKNGLGLLWVVYAGLMLWLAFQTWRTHSKPVQVKVEDKTTSVGYRWEDTNPVQHTPVTTEPTFWFMVAVTVIAIVIHILITADYK